MLEPVAADCPRPYFEVLDKMHYRPKELRHLTVRRCSIKSEREWMSCKACKVDEQSISAVIPPPVVHQLQMSPELRSS